MRLEYDDMDNAVMDYEAGIMVAAIDPDGMMSENVDAAGRLLAAAPDLYGAAKEIRAVLTYQGDSRGDWWGRKQRAIDALEAALRKAETGEVRQ